MPTVPEEVTRRLWETHSAGRTDLSTTDGLSVYVLSPGRWNHDAGPDFLDARVRIGHRLFRGDIEVHRSASAWTAHGHHNDPHYNRVVLHVVASRRESVAPAVTQAGRVVATIVLTHVARNDRYAVASAVRRRSAAEALRLRIRSAHNPRALLQRWGWRWFEEKVGRLYHRFEQILTEQAGSLCEPGVRYEGRPEDIPVPHTIWTRQELGSSDAWDQLLYEGIMEGLGYAKNRAPFLALSRHVPLNLIRRTGGTVEDILPLFFGAAGLLPSSRGLPDQNSRRYVLDLRRRWRTLQSALHVPVLHEADWLFFRLRPSNFPTARLAYMAFLIPHLFSPHSGFSAVHAILTARHGTPKDRLKNVRTLFRCLPDTYWRHHLHFRSIPSPRGASLGTERITTLLLTVVLPMAALYARLLGQKRLERQARFAARTLPPGRSIAELRESRKVCMESGLDFLSGLEVQGVRMLVRKLVSR